VLRHEALFYGDPVEFLAGVGAFLDQGLEAGEPVMAAVPGPRLELLRERYGEAVRYVDMTRLGRNPSRIIPAVREWLEGRGNRAARFVGEPIWPGRSACEAAEGLRHEALLNLAFADDDVAILCPYDSSALDADVVGDAELTHPLLVCRGHTSGSARYADPKVVYAAADRALPPPAGPVSRIDVTPDLADVRRFVSEHAASARLDDDRSFDLLVAANEAAANTLIHGDGRGVVSAWRDDSSLVLEISDRGGSIADPLIGRRMPDPEKPHGRGLWMINQLCDLVELRPGAGGTTLRLHMSLA
jgi:anti-sigma regulatory factor (Ser/Thr protein kinase)